MISRRQAIKSGICVAAMASCPPALARASSGLVIADPALLTADPPAGILAASGHALMQAILPRIEEIDRLEAIVTPADRVMLAELLRFRPRMHLATGTLAEGSETIAGRLLGRAEHLLARPL